MFKANLKNSVRASRGRTAIVVGGLAACVLPVSSAWAAVVNYDAVNNPDEASFFAVNFGDGDRSAEITTTQFTIAVDADAGQASFVSYYQQVDPILLPGDVSTGNITISTLPALSTGTTWDADGVRHFSITDTYVIEFEADLSGFGLTSPQYVTSTSNGTIDFGRSAIGEINADWTGQGEIGDPDNPLIFDYLCQVRTIIVPEPASIALLGLIGLAAMARRG